MNSDPFNCVRHSLCNLPQHDQPNYLCKRNLKVTECSWCSKRTMVPFPFISISPRISRGIDGSCAAMAEAAACTPFVSSWCATINAGTMTGWIIFKLCYLMTTLPWWGVWVWSREVSDLRALDPPRHWRRLHSTILTRHVNSTLLLLRPKTANQTIAQ
jgi:hypothetical protein